MPHAGGQPGVQLLVACEARRRREETLAHVAHLVLTRVILTRAALKHSGAAQMTRGAEPYRTPITGVYGGILHPDFLPWAYTPRPEASAGGRRLQACGQGP